MTKKSKRDEAEKYDYVADLRSRGYTFRPTTEDWNRSF